MVEYYDPLGNCTDLAPLTVIACIAQITILSTTFTVPARIEVENPARICIELTLPHAQIYAAIEHHAGSKPAAQDTDSESFRRVTYQKDQINKIPFILLDDQGEPLTLGWRSNVDRYEDRLAQLSDAS